MGRIAPGRPQVFCCVDTGVMGGKVYGSQVDTADELKVHTKSLARPPRPTPDPLARS